MYIAFAVILYILREYSHIFSKTRDWKAFTCLDLSPPVECELCFDWIGVPDLKGYCKKSLSECIRLIGLDISSLKDFRPNKSKKYDMCFWFAI